MAQSIEERLAMLEGKTLPLINMRDQLYDDYGKLVTMLSEADEALGNARRVETEMYQRLTLIEETYEREEAAMLATDERASGKNDIERKRNANALIHNERAEDGKLHGVWMVTIGAQEDLGTAITEKESCIDRFSAVKYILRTVSGLAYSLGA